MATYKKENKLPREDRVLLKLEQNDEFMETARRIAGLIKEVGSLPTPRQIKIHLQIDARKMRAVCGSEKVDPYNLLVKEARRILKKEEGLTVGFGRVELAPPEE